MPLTGFQKGVLHILAARRSPESHVAGGLVLNRAPDSPRYSKDVDIFHDSMESVVVSADADAALLGQHGFNVRWDLRTPMLQRATIERGGEALRLDWCYDSAFRFFPIQPDAEFGYALHPADVAVNKRLAMAGRTEVRDCIDLLHLHRTYLTVGALCWGASGKDPGLTPWLMLDLAKRNAKYPQEALRDEILARPVDLVELKQQLLDAADSALALFERLPAEEIGCLYLDPAGKPVTPNPDVPEFRTLTRHFGSVRGAWPTLTDLK